MKLMIVFLLIVFSLAATSPTVLHRAKFSWENTEEINPYHQLHFMDQDPHILDGFLTENSKSSQEKSLANKNENIDEEYERIKEEIRNLQWDVNVKAMKKEEAQVKDDENVIDKMFQAWTKKTDNIAKTKNWQKYNFNNDEVNPKHEIEEEDQPTHAFNGKKEKVIFGLQKKYTIQPATPITAQSKNDHDLEIAEQSFELDPILNSNALKNHIYRRDFVVTDEINQDTSSSLDMDKDFKEEFKELWFQKKIQAMNQSMEHGDQINMLAARPWGMLCGDPNQNDAPRGTCTLPMECDAENRIYRADHYCGRTQFVCCAVLLSTYDTAHAFDFSFESATMEIDSRDKPATLSPKEEYKLKKAKERRKRRRLRKQRKNKMRKEINKIVHAIRKLITQTYRNRSNLIKRKTRYLKRFVKDLKQQFAKDRKTLHELHQSQMLTIDNKLMDRLRLIAKFNKHFAENATFRDIINAGSMSVRTAKMLTKAYPDLEEFLQTRRGGGRVADDSGGSLLYEMDGY